MIDVTTMRCRAGAQRESRLRIDARYPDRWTALLRGRVGGHRENHRHIFAFYCVEGPVVRKRYRIFRNTGPIRKTLSRPDNLSPRMCGRIVNEEGSASIPSLRCRVSGQSRTITGRAAWGHMRACGASDTRKSAISTSDKNGRWRASCGV